MGTYVWESWSWHLGLPWALVGIGAGLVPMSQLLARTSPQPWADCTASTNELIGEDSRVIIRLGANRLMS